MKPHDAPASIPAASETGTAMMAGDFAQLDADDDRAERAHQELALGADVEQAGLECEPDRQAAEQQRHRRTSVLTIALNDPTEPLISAP